MGAIDRASSLTAFQIKVQLYLLYPIQKNAAPETMASDFIAGLGNAFGDDGDGEDSQAEDSEPEESPCGASRGEFKRLMNSMVAAQREAAQLKRRLESTTEDLDRYMASDAAACAQLAAAEKRNRQLAAERDLVGARLSQVELTLRNERDEHAPVKDALYRESEVAKTRVVEYSERVSELSDQIRRNASRRDSEATQSPVGAGPVPFKDYGAHDPDLTGCVACAVAINKKYAQLSFGS